MAARLDDLMSLQFPQVRHAYSERDLILYALGLGLPTDTLDPASLRFVYEDGLAALPTFAVVAGHPGFWIKTMNTGLDATRVVHGEQTLRLHRPLPPSGVILADSQIVGVADKGPDKGAVIFYERTLSLEDGSPLATVGQAVFCRGDGGIGSAGEAPTVAARAAPDRAPDFVSSMTVSARAAIIYRLSGDYNPLHIDPKVALTAGFPKPILHGLATYGVAGYALVEGPCGGDPSRLQALDCRFLSPVFPGETLETSIWVEGGQATFQTRVVERDKVVLSNGGASFLAIGSAREADTLLQH
jgi:acyl dehydratase